jgi:hypothetical protein
MFQLIWVCYKELVSTTGAMIWKAVYEKLKMMDNTSYEAPYLPIF